MPRVGGAPTPAVLSSGPCIGQASEMHFKCVGPQKSAPKRTFEKFLKTLAAKQKSQEEESGRLSSAKHPRHVDLEKAVEQTHVDRAGGLT